MFERFRKGRGKSEDEAFQADPTILLGGAFRSLDENQCEKFTALAGQAFPDFAKRISCFGSDWAGRLFATDNARLEDGRELVLLLEPGTGEVLQIPCDREEFLSTELLQHSDAAVALEFFHAWVSQGGKVPSRNECVGYRQPLFLGGVDQVSNLELSDMEVYWSVMAQILDQVRGLPPGTKIGKISISE
jgi:hypothetical protein